MRLLLVSPQFPPTNAADAQRLRMLLPHLGAAGCRAEVLAVEPASLAAPLDPWQAEGLPADVPVHRVRGLPLAWSRLPGLGGVPARTLGALDRAGSRLLRRGGFDGVYVSTTAFGLFRLGPRWRRRFGVPFVLDYQDPWVNDFYRQHPAIRPPGGRLKQAVSDRLNRFHEPRVLRHASGITAVSADYGRQIRGRYPWLQTLPELVLPFPGEPADFTRLPDPPPWPLPFDPHDGLLHWVSIGRGGPDLAMALEGLFSAIAGHADPQLRRRLRLHFLGTSYAAAGRGIPSVRPLAERHGLGDCVHEQTDRLPLSQALSCLRAADALLVIGSSDAGYTASKIYPYLLARRPLLAVMHRRSSVVDLLQRCGGGQVVTFDSDDSPGPLAAAIEACWLRQGAHGRVVPLQHAAFAPCTARAQAAELTAFLQRCLQP